MRFLQTAAFALTASLALVDARAIHKRSSNANGGIAERGNNGVTEDLKPRWTNGVNGEKLSVRGLFGLGDDVQVSKPGFEKNAKACGAALNKLRKLRHKRAARAERKVRRKRADPNDPSNDDIEDQEEDVEDEETDMGDDMELDDDFEEGKDLGDGSHTVGMDQSEYFPFENGEGASILGTIGLNSCSGVLIVGEKGAIIAHLLPISPNEGLNEKSFKESVTNKVSNLYTANQESLGGAKMYIAVPNSDNGEKAILEQAANNLGIAKDTTGYDRVADEVWDTENYFETGRGTLYVDFSSQGNPKVKVFGNDK